MRIIIYAIQFCSSNPNAEKLDSENCLIVELDKYVIGHRNDKILLEKQSATQNYNT